MRLKTRGRKRVTKRPLEEEQPDTAQKKPRNEQSTGTSSDWHTALTDVVIQKGVLLASVHTGKQISAVEAQKEKKVPHTDIHEDRTEAVKETVAKTPQREKSIDAKKKKQLKTKKKNIENIESEEENTKSDDGYKTRQSKSLSTRMSPYGIFKMISKLSPQQRQAVEDIGFGGLLKLTLSECHGQLSKYLVENFDFCRCSLVLEKEELELSEEDVVSTMDLPRGKNVVVEAKGDKDNNEYSELLASWRKRWSITVGSPITKNMADQIVTRGDFGDEFKRDFVVFVVSCLLNGHQNRSCNYKILFSLINVNQIKELNWCHYTVKSLVQSVQEWKKKPSGFFTGPITFLLLSYLDRVVFKVRDVESRNLPTLSCWTAVRVRHRVKEELEAGGFGKGKVVDIFKNMKCNEGEEKEIQRSESSKPTDVRKDCVEKVSVFLKKMTAAAVEFRESMVEIGKVHLGNKILKKIFTSLSEKFNNVPSSQGEEPAAINICNTIVDKDDIFNGSSFLQAVTELEKAISKIQKNPAGKAIDVPSFSLGLIEKDDGNDEVTNQEGNVEERVVIGDASQPITPEDEPHKLEKIFD